MTRPTQWTSASSIIAGLFLIVGCSDAPDSSVSALAEEPGSERVPNDVRVDLSNWKDIERSIVAHQGKVVVVDLWSTTCAPCRREFPGLVKLQQTCGTNIACISVSVDFYGDENEPPESFRRAVTAFLESQGATFANFICTDSSDYVLGVLDASAVPTVLVYDRDGTLVKMFEDDGTFGDDGFTYEQHIGPLVEKLLAESP